MTEKFPEDFSPLKDLVGDYTERDFQKQLRNYFSESIRKTNVDNFIMLVRKYRDNFRLLAVHKYITELFRDIEQELPKEKFEMAKVAIFLEFDNGIDSIVEGKTANYSKEKFYREIEFVKTFAIPLCKSFVSHKNNITNVYKTLIQNAERNEVFGLDNMILFHCFMYMDSVNNIIYQYAKKNNDINLLWAEYLKIFLIYKLGNQVQELEGKLNKVAIPSVEKVRSEISDAFPEDTKSKLIGRPPIVTLDMLLNCIKLRDQNSHLTPSDVFSKISEKYKLSKSTIRKWFSHNKKFLPNYHQYKNRRPAKLFKSITEDQVKALYKNYSEDKSKG